MNDIYCCNSFTAALPVFSLPIMIVKTSAIKKTFSDFFFFSPNLFSMNNKENGSRVSCIFLKQSGVRGRLFLGVFEL